ncbi:anti-sigma factor domain-containing protein [Streptomyces sp. cmx-4-9]|uniref:anti-sigma factor n=1 Tax=Streptomyces sp. cmx-4-9 TaxID=2790941 RepID=UPI00397FD0D2
MTTAPDPHPAPNPHPVPNPHPAPDPHSALAVYVLHALPPEEDAAFARHLAGCARCRREAAALRAVAGELAGLPGAAPPPPALRGRVLRRIAATPQERTASGAAQPQPQPYSHPQPHAAAVRPSRSGRALRWALAACLALAVVLGGTAYQQHREAEDARSRLAAVRQAPAARLAGVLAAPDARISTTEFPDGATGCVIVSRRDGRAAFIVSGLPRLSPGQVYALWYDDLAGARPAGTFPGRGTWHIELLDGPAARARAVGVTVEPVGGSARPSTEPIGVIDIPA